MTDTTNGGVREPGEEPQVPEPANDETTQPEGEQHAAAPESAIDSPHEAVASDAAESAQHQGEAGDLPTGDVDTASQPVVEPTVIAPSTLRGPSHYPARTGEQPTVEDEAAADAAAEPIVAEQEPPALVEPKRPTLSLRRELQQDPVAAAEAEVAGAGTAPSSASPAGGEPLGGSEAGSSAPDTATKAFDSVAPEAASDAGRDDSAAIDDTEVIEPVAVTEPDYVEGQPTQALSREELNAELAAANQAPTVALVPPTTVHDEPTLLPTDAELASTARISSPASIPVDEQTARATALGGDPIVLVETPQPPRKKGARGVGFLVVLLATIIFGGLLAGIFLAVGYLFGPSFVGLGLGTAADFDLNEQVQSLWLQPAWLLPVAVFFIVYWLWTVIVNRAGWWAHVLGAFIIALIVYGAAMAGLFLGNAGGWLEYREFAGITLREIGTLLVSPFAVLAFVFAREVPVWVGGIVARRGRKAKRINKENLEAYERENADALAAYERSRA